MRKISILLSMLVLAAMVLAACGGEETATNLPSTQVPQITADVTEAMTEPATDVPTEDATGTPGVPVTGELNPARLSNQLDFNIWNQNGEQIGEVNDMVLDLDNSQVAYVIVGTGGFLEIGEKDVLVPWDSLQLQTGTGDTTGGEENAFIFQGDQELFNNAPDTDINAVLPERGTPAGDWDVDIRNYWEGGVVPGATEPGTTATGEATEAATEPATEAATEAATEMATEPATGQGQALQGVVLATDVLGSGVTLGMQGTGTGEGTEPAATEAATEPATEAATEPAAGAATATLPATGQGTAGPGLGTGVGQGDFTGTIEDMIVDTDTGDILYIVVNSTFADGDRWIPVPLRAFQWDAGAEVFLLDADANMIQNAPFFQDGEFPDTTAEGWDAEFDTFWQNNGAGTGTGAAEATATP